MTVRTHVKIAVHNVWPLDCESMEWPLYSCFGLGIGITKIEDWRFIEAVDDTRKGGFEEPWATIIVAVYMEDNRDVPWRETNFIRMVSERLGRNDIAVVFEWTPVEPIRRSVYHKPDSLNENNVRQLKLDRYEEPIKPW